MDRLPFYYDYCETCETHTPHDKHQDCMICSTKYDEEDKLEWLVIPN
jgi:uncharacterized paraquat-inducible protein A